ncbi:MAG: hypothetical protein E7616_05565 [Ruminococcaceae bacterium]|nr:hypothetical protein [Oscillospiraceae bacterium]
MPRRGENVFRRKNGLWEARYVKEIDADGKKKYGSVYAHSYREVKEKRQGVLDSILICQKPATSRSITVETLVKEYLCIKRNRLKISTYQRYDSFLKSILNQLSANAASYTLLHLLFMNLRAIV